MITPLDVDVLILAGGLGTRARAYLGDVPKITAPLTETTTVLDHLLTYLMRQRVRRATLALGWGHEAVLERLRTAPTHGVDVTIVVDDPPTGQRAAIRQALASGALLSDPIVVMNGDTLHRLDLATLLNRFDQLRKAGVRHLSAITMGSVPVGVHVINAAHAALADWPAIGVPYPTSTGFVDVGTVEGYETARRMVADRRG